MPGSPSRMVSAPSLIRLEPCRPDHLGHNAKAELVKAKREKRGHTVTQWDRVTHSRCGRSL